MYSLYSDEILVRKFTKFWVRKTLQNFGKKQTDPTYGSSVRKHRTTMDRTNDLL
jgi:hypothetical protein